MLTTYSQDQETFQATYLYYIDSVSKSYIHGGMGGKKIITKNTNKKQHFEK